LAQQEHRVILLERQRMATPSRDRLRSGEGLIPRTLQELIDLDIAVADAPWALSRIQRIRTVRQNGAVKTTAIDRMGGILQIDRACFEDVLRDAAERAGVDVRLGWRVRQFYYTPDRIAGVVVQPPGDQPACVLRAPIVIDASGRNALSLRSFDLRIRAGAGDFGAVVMFFDQVDGLEPDVWELHMFGSGQLSVVQLSQIEPGIVRCGLGCRARSSCARWATRRTSSGARSRSTRRSRVACNAVSSCGARMYARALATACARSRLMDYC